MMHVQDVLDIMTWLDAAGIAVWLDGGWGIDALVGEQTRPHDDLDVVIAMADVGNTQHVLRQHGFMLAEDDLPTRFVLRDPLDRRIDVHPVTFDTDSGMQRLQDGSCFRYPAEGFHGRGRVAGHPVPCLTAAVQMRCHVGYVPDADDDHDVRLLQTHFGLALPPAYQR